MTRDEDHFPGAAGSGTAVEEHPATDELVDYAAELDRELEPRVRRHLEGCAECRDLVRDLADYPALEPPGEAYRVDEEEVRRTLGALRTQLLDPANRPPSEPERPAASTVTAWRDEEAFDKLELMAAAAVEPFRDAVPGAVLPSWPTPASSPAIGAFGWSRASRWVWAAAALVLLSLGTYHQIRVRDLKFQLADAAAALRQPRANARVVRLFSADNPLRGSVGPLGDAGVTLAIQPPEPLPPGVYTGEIRNLAGDTVLEISGLEPQAAGLTFYLPPEALPAGDYRVRLIREDGEVWPTSFELQIVE